MSSPLDKLILDSVKCTICGAGYGKCDCWVRCTKCGWSFENGTKCRHCAGDGGLEVVAMSKPRRRKR
jgi:hypothetical protein